MAGFIYQNNSLNNTYKSDNTRVYRLDADVLMRLNDSKNKEENDIIEKIETMNLRTATQYVHDQMVQSLKMSIITLFLIL